MQDDRRSARRIETTYPAWIIPGQARLVPCTVVNVSPKGAQLCISASMVMPKFFDLHYAANGSAPRGCALAWRAADRIGIRFMNSGDRMHEGASAPAAGRKGASLT
jgi:hypothetical protein